MGCALGSQGFAVGGCVWCRGEIGTQGRFVGFLLFPAMVGPHGCATMHDAVLSSPAASPLPFLSTAQSSECFGL